MEITKEALDTTLEPLPKSLWAKYLKERLDQDTLEYDGGFVVYKVLDTHIHILEMYVEPKKRRQKLAWKMADIMAQLAKNLKRNKLLCNVYLSANGCDQSLKAILAYGFKPITIGTADVLYLEKEV